MNKESSVQLEAWEKEVLAWHRWGQHGDRAERELSRLRARWGPIQPVDENMREVLEQIIALEICNWDLEESILALCQAIGTKRPAKRAIGHRHSISEERWAKVWAYYAALRKWLEIEGRGSGYGTLLKLCDPEGEVERHVHELLGERAKLKELYVERFCLFLEFALRDKIPPDSAPMRVHVAAASMLEEEIKANGPEESLLNALTFIVYEDLPCYPGLELCHHKLFRRLDIITSSIGAERWRVAMLRRGTDGLDRAKLLESYLSPIEMWVEGATGKAGGGDVVEQAVSFLGEQDDDKLFMASLLVSLLRAQQVAARKRAGGKSKRPHN